MKGDAYSRPQGCTRRVRFCENNVCQRGKCARGVGETDKSPTLGLTTWAMSMIRPPTTAWCQRKSSESSVGIGAGRSRISHFMNAFGTWAIWNARENGNRKPPVECCIARQVRDRRVGRSKVRRRSHCTYPPFKQSEPFYTDLAKQVAQGWKGRAFSPPAEGTPRVCVGTGGGPQAAAALPSSKARGAANENEQRERVGCRRWFLIRYA